MFSAAKASERARARRVSSAKKITSRDVILARTICVPVACVMMTMMMNFIHVSMYLADANWGHNIKIK